jgi:hypothetical protein
MVFFQVGERIARRKFLRMLQAWFRISSNGSRRRLSLKWTTKSPRSQPTLISKLSASTRILNFGLTEGYLSLNYKIFAAEKCIGISTVQRKVLRA